MISLAIGFLISSFIISLLMFGVLERLNIVDEPDGGRKAQTHAVPRLGGVAILTGVMVGSLMMLLASSVMSGEAVWTPIARIAALSAGLELALMFAGAAFMIGLLDDIWTLNTKLKLFALAIMSIVCSSMGLIPDALTSPLGALKLPWLLLIGSALWLLVFTNAANFMDGANGLAIGSLTIMIAGLLWIAASAGDWTLTMLWPWLALFGAIAGFLVHNLRGALYAGDAGALGMGALFAGMGLISGLEVWTVATLALPFLVDVLLTLVWRAKHGRNWLEAHLDHAYQRLRAQGWSHFETAFLYWGLSATAAILAYIAAQAGGMAPFIVFWTLCLAGSVIWVRHRRSAERDDLGR